MLNDVAKIDEKLISSAISLFDCVISSRKSKFTVALSVAVGTGNDKIANETGSQFIQHVLV